MQVYNYSAKEAECSQMEEHPVQLVPDDCFLDLKASPDLVVTQGADLSIRFCGEVLQQRPKIACIGPAYITTDTPSCVVVGDVIEITCIADCDLAGSDLRQQTVSAISADKLKITLVPGFPSITVEKCYRAEDLEEGCLDLSQPMASAPRFITLGTKWTLYGIAAHRISNGCVRSLGVTVASGYKTVRTALIGVVQPGDHMSIPSAGIVDATVIMVKTQDTATGEVDVITVDQAAKATGCFPAMVADGLLLSFDVITEGACQVATIPASQTAKLKPPFGVDVPAEANPQTFLGHYLFAAQTVVLVSGKPTVRTIAIDSGLLVLKSTVASSNSLGGQI